MNTRSTHHVQQLRPIEKKVNLPFLKKSTLSASKVHRDPVLIQIDPHQPLLILVDQIDWEAILERVQNIRAKRLKFPQMGRKPQLRILVALLILRALRKCTLQEASDLAQHYAPARIFCGFQDNWTPDFRTLWDFELQMGEEGMKVITLEILGIANQLGYTDGKTLCSDTTAQEASIPYPTEVGLMQRFAARSTQGFVKTVGLLKSALGEKIGSLTKKIFREARYYRLFSKTKEMRMGSKKTN